jgi:hypothetical protein
MPTRRKPSSDGGCQPGGSRLRMVDANPAEAVFGWWMPTRRRPSSDGGCQPGGDRLRMVDANPAETVFGWWKPTRRRPSSDGGSQPGGDRLRMVEANPAETVFGWWKPTRRKPSSDGGSQLEPGPRGLDPESEVSHLTVCTEDDPSQPVHPGSEREPREGGCFGRDSLGAFSRLLHPGGTTNPRGDDPPPTPHRYWSCAVRVLGRGCRPSLVLRLPRSTVNGPGGRPPFDPPPVMPRGDDPPSTPRRCWWRGGGVLGRGCGPVSCHGCHVPDSWPPASGLLLRACCDAQGGRPPFDPPPVLVLPCSRAWPGVQAFPRASVATFRIPGLWPPASGLLPPSSASAFLRVKGRRSGPLVLLSLGTLSACPIQSVSSAQVKRSSKRSDPIGG